MSKWLAKAFIHEDCQIQVPGSQPNPKQWGDARCNTALLGKTATEDRWQRDDSCDMVRWGEGTTSAQHAGGMLRVLPETQLHTTGHSSGTRRTSSGPTVWGNSNRNGGLMWRKGISYLMGRKKVTLHKNITSHSRGRFDIYKLCKGNQWSLKNIYTNEQLALFFFKANINVAQRISVISVEQTLRDFINTIGQVCILQITSWEKLNAERNPNLIAWSVWQNAQCHLHS